LRQCAEEFLQVALFPLKFVFSLGGKLLLRLLQLERALSPVGTGGGGEKAALI